jgi:PAS domain S-box-containing protein
MVDSKAFPVGGTATRRRLDRRIQAMVAAAISALLLVGTISYLRILVWSESIRWIRHTYEVLEKLEDVRLSVANIEASARGFALTGEESLLDAFRANVARVIQDEADVRRLTTDNPAQQRELSLFEEVTQREIQLASAINERRRAKGLVGAVAAISNSPDQPTMDELQVLVHQLEKEELRLLGLRNADASRRLAQIKSLIILGTLLAVLIAVAAGRSVKRDNAKCALAEDALRLSEDEYRALVDGIHDYAIVMLDPDGQILSWNPGAERMTGRTVKESIGQNFSRVFPEEDIRRGKPQEILRKAAAGGLFEEVGTRARRDGSHFLVRTTYRALRNRAENLRGFSVVSRELPERAASVAQPDGR